MATVFEPGRELEVIEQAEVVVAGGGPGGVAAAIAAGREGADVLLVERYGYLGGLATGGNVIALPPFEEGGDQVIQGLAHEFRATLEGKGAARRPASAWREDVCEFDPEAWKVLSLSACREAGVRFLFHAWVAAVIAGDRTVEAIVIESKSGRHAVQGRVFVDATGDGDVLAWAGAEFEKSDHRIGLVPRIGAVDIDRFEQWRAENAGEWGAVCSEMQERFGAVWGAGRSYRDDVTWLNNGVVGDALDVRDLTRIEVTLREQIAGVHALYRERVPGFEDSFVLDTAPQIGTRESRRITGLHRLTLEDLAGGRFEDSVGLGNRYDIEGHVWQFPYRCLVPSGIANGLATGRCISTTHEAHEFTREIHNCLTVGQAAGAAAAMASRAGTPVAELDVSDLQSRLRRQGARLE
jgi:ribulose 1,5-bisphosphate synthetase/thiazole synthase